MSAARQPSVVMWGIARLRPPAVHAYHPFRNRQGVHVRARRTSTSRRGRDGTSCVPPPSCVQCGVHTRGRPRGGGPV